MFHRKLRAGFQIQIKSNSNKTQTSKQIGRWRVFLELLIPDYLRNLFQGNQVSESEHV